MRINYSSLVVVGQSASCQIAENNWTCSGTSRLELIQHVEVNENIIEVASSSHNERGGAIQLSNAITANVNRTCYIIFNTCFVVAIVVSVSRCCYRRPRNNR